ncbi:MAG: hypothetical protein ACK5SQ_02150 [Chitinophagales bacterium]|jgi:hypothetical protein
MHSIKMMLFFLAFTCLQTVPSHALHTNLQPVVEVSLLAPELPAYSGAVELAEDGWVVYHESAKIKMEYRLAECHDTANDIHFAYYLLRITNKTSKKMNVGLVLGEGDRTTNDITLRDQEHYRSLILAPGEVLESECGTKNRDLRIYAKELKKTDAQPATFKISKIREYEL